MDSVHPAIEIVAVGECPAELLRELPPVVAARFPGRVARLADHGLARPDYAYSPKREQYDAGEFLSRLARLETDAELLLGVVDLDLFVPDLNFIFGLASKGGPALVALSRLRPEFWGSPADPKLLLQRAIKEVVHELGHAYGLDHCSNPACVMRFSNALGETDRKSDRFCSQHEAQLARSLGP